MLPSFLPDFTCLTRPVAGANFHCFVNPEKTIELRLKTDGARPPVREEGRRSGGKRHVLCPGLSAE